MTSYDPYPFDKQDLLYPYPGEEDLFEEDFYPEEDYGFDDYLDKSLDRMYSQEIEDWLIKAWDREEKEYEAAQEKHEAECFSIELYLAGIRQRKL